MTENGVLEFPETDMEDDALQAAVQTMNLGGCFERVIQCCS